MIRIDRMEEIKGRNMTNMSPQDGAQSEGSDDEDDNECELIAIRSCLTPTPGQATLRDLETHVKPDVAHVALGVACGLRALMRGYLDEGERPKVINERQFPLFGLNAPVASFNWTGLEPDLDIPSIHAVRELVLILTTHLGMTSKDLVVAFVCFEECLRRNSAVLRTYTCRPMFIACCVIALKVTNDHETTLKAIHKALKHVFTAMTLLQLKYLEMKVLETMGWHVPMRAVYQTYANALIGAANKTSGTSQTAPSMIDACDPA